jgi:hypothetical protein
MVALVVEPVVLADLVTTLELRAREAFPITSMEPSQLMQVVAVADHAPMVRQLQAQLALMVVELVDMHRVEPLISLDLTELQTSEVAAEEV